MDPELRQTLETLEQRMVTRIAGEIRTSEARMLTRMAAEIQTSEARMVEHVTASVRTSENRTHRHMTVLIEGLRSDFRIATEAIAPLNRKVDALEEQGAHAKQRVDGLEDRVAALERGGKTRRRRPK